MSKNFAHRGFSGAYPENTMLAFQKALEAQCDGIELDVHLARNGELVIIHDETVDRTTNGRGFIGDMDYQEIRGLDAGKGEHIPALGEYFDLVEKQPVVTNIELKNGVIWYAGMEEKVIAMVRRRGLEDRVIFSSFNHFSMLKCKKLAPEIRCGFLAGDWIINAGAYTKTHGMESYHPEFYSLNDEAVREIHAQGISVNTWTVNSRKDMERLVSLGVEGIITNDPALLHDVLQGFPPHGD
jgi:glycerophosphoryl diester phosphodiesterase